MYPCHLDHPHAPTHPHPQPPHTPARPPPRAPRLSDINLLVWGVDLVEEALMLSVGIPSRPPAALCPLAQIAEFCVNAPATGLLQGFAFLDKWQASPGVLYAIPLVQARGVPERARAGWVGRAQPCFFRGRIRHPAPEVCTAPAEPLALSPPQQAHPSCFKHIGPPLCPLPLLYYSCFCCP
jgi:hypothetical protein